MKLLYEAQIMDEETGNVLTKISSYSREGLEEEMGKGKWTKVDELKIKDEAELEVDGDENEATAEARPNN